MSFYFFVLLSFFVHCSAQASQITLLHSQLATNMQPQGVNAYENNLRIAAQHFLATNDRKLLEKVVHRGFVQAPTTPIEQRPTVPQPTPPPTPKPVTVPPQVLHKPQTQQFVPQVPAPKPQPPRQPNPIIERLKAIGNNSKLGYVAHVVGGAAGMALGGCISAEILKFMNNGNSVRDTHPACITSALAGLGLGAVGLPKLIALLRNG